MRKYQIADIQSVLGTRYTVHVVKNYSLYYIFFLFISSMEQLEILYILWIDTQTHTHRQTGRQAGRQRDKKYYHYKFNIYSMIAQWNMQIGLKIDREKKNRYKIQDISRNMRVNRMNFYHANFFFSVQKKHAC